MVSTLKECKFESFRGVKNFRGILIIMNLISDFV